MRDIVTVSAAFLMLAGPSLLECRTTPVDPLFSSDQLDNLLAPVALYPDPLLAQLLVAATYPDQIVKASQFIHAHSNPKKIDHQFWSGSVKSVAHYPTVLDMMASQIDWTTSLGQAYVAQSADVMASVQRLRAEAMAAGNLQSNDQIQVVNNAGDIEIWPAQDQTIYVPAYDPSLAYVESDEFDFGLGWPIGPWLNADFIWPSRNIFYHGWTRNEGWITRSRPYNRKLGVYATLGFTNPPVNKAVLKQTVNYARLSRYNSVHTGVTYRPGTLVTKKPQPHKKVNQQASTATRSPGGYHAPAYGSASAHSSGGGHAFSGGGGGGGHASSGGGGGHSSGGGGGHSSGGGGGRR